MVRSRYTLGIPTLASAAIAALWGVLVAHAADHWWWGLVFAALSAAAGGLATWWRGQRPASELEDALTSAIGAAIFAGLAPLIPLIVLLSSSN